MVGDGGGGSGCAIHCVIMGMKKEANKDTSCASIVLNGQAFSIGEVAAVARAEHGGCVVSLGEIAQERITKSRAVVESALRSGEAIYGVNTGFGSLARTRIVPDEVRDMQRNLIRSHAAGVGEPLGRDVVRAMIVLLVGSLCRGYSGVRPVVVERLIDLLNCEITPVVPSRGSVGASGDLAPLSHLALVLIGEGKAAFSDGRIVGGAEALEAYALEPIVLDAKEGLALINGTHLMTAIAALALDDVARLFDAALVSAGMMIDACLATDVFLDDRLHSARNQVGQRKVAARLREILSGSEIVVSHKEDDPRVQDPYSLRCIPQVLGAVWDVIEFARSVVERELGAVTDNPLVFEPGEVSGDEGDSAKCAVENILSGGNFHGMPLALAMDSLKVAVAHIAGMSERRVYYLLSASDSENPINVYLSPKPGLYSGLMIVQYTAAACCNEIQTLTGAASVANIPTSAGQEDYNSFGPTAGFQLRRAIDLARHVVAIEFFCASEAMEYHRPLKSGGRVEAAHQRIREVVPRLTEDRSPTADIEGIAELIGRGGI